MKNHMEEVWGFSMRKRPYKAKSESPSTPSVKIESPNGKPYLYFPSTILLIDK